MVRGLWEAKICVYICAPRTQNRARVGKGFVRRKEGITRNFLE